MAAKAKTHAKARRSRRKVPSSPRIGPNALEVGRVVLTAAMKKRVGTWIRQTYEGGSYNNFDELHVDQIEARFKEHRYWITSGLAAIEFAAEFIQRHKIPFLIALDFSLRRGRKPVKVQLTSRADLNRWLSNKDGPPRLMMLKPDWPPLRKTMALDVKPEELFGQPLSNVTVHLWQFENENKEVIRTLSVRALPNG
ncbi:MAG: hypothetical protein IT462_08965 [Planctomycetes bacterium]|nr:hypothetical protein [Planctomycetota bacterium]